MATIAMSPSSSLACLSQGMLTKPQPTKTAGHRKSRFGLCDPGHLPLDLVAQDVELEDGRGLPFPLALASDEAKVLLPRPSGPLLGRLGLAVDEVEILQEPALLQGLLSHDSLPISSERPGVLPTRVRAAAPPEHCPPPGTLQGGAGTSPPPIGAAPRDPRAGNSGAAVPA